MNSIIFPLTCFADRVSQTLQVYTIASVFDFVLVDAPCSGSGLFRKDPSALNEWSTDAVSFCANSSGIPPNVCLSIILILYYNQVFRAFLLLSAHSDIRYQQNYLSHLDLL